LDPRNSLETRSTTRVTDPFEISLTTAEQRLTALKAVKLAQDHLRETRARAAQNIERAENDVVAAMKAADMLGAYAVVPDFKPAARVAS
jgi:hypothetical protein